MERIRRYGIRSVLLILAVILIISVAFLIYRKYRQGIINSQSAEIVRQGGVSEMREIDLNGARQYIVVETQDTMNPVVLFLHGGPGMAAPFGASSRGLYPEITKRVTAVYWDQRGAGKSFPGISPETLTVRQFTDDVLALSEILKEEFDQEKIYIVAVSWGTIPGLKAVAERPELYHAYLAYAQMTNMIKSEEIVYHWLLENASEKDIDFLKKVGLPPYSNESDNNSFSAISDRVTGEGEVKPDLPGLLSGVLYSPDYSLSDIYNTIFRATTFNMEQTGLTDEIYAVNFLKDITQIDVPVYLFNGRHDKVVPLDLTQEYFNLISAPSKELICLKESGHMPSPDDLSRMTDELINKIYSESNIASD